MNGYQHTNMRLMNIFRNSFFALLSQFVLILMGFFSQRVMNLTMGEQLVGMNSVISNIIALLSVSELGIASAIVYHLYQALADRDEEAIASLMNLYRRAYFVFAAVITVMGLCVMPFVHLFLKENSFSLSYIRQIYFLWLMRTALSYLLSYKRSILIADQKEYIVSIVTLMINIANYSAIIVILRLWQNYPLALLLNIVVEASLNIWIICYVNKKYPFLQAYRKAPSDKKRRSIIFGDIKNIFISRLSSKLLVSTDSLIMSSFISVGMVGKYSNYSLITQSLMNIMLSLSNAIQPSVGNMFTEKNQEKNYQVLRQITFLFFLLASFCSAGLMSLMTRFVSDVWLAKEYCLETDIVVICVVNFYSFIMSLPTAMMMTVGGMFDKERNVSVLYAAANLVISLLLVRPFGVIGVLIGTLVSYLVQILFRIRIFFRHYLKKSSQRYLLDLFEYSVLAAAETWMTYVIVGHIYQNGGWIRFFLCIFLCVLIPNMANLILFIKSWQLQSMIQMVKMIGRKKDEKGK